MGMVTSASQASTSGGREARAFGPEQEGESLRSRETMEGNGRRVDHGRHQRKTSGTQLFQIFWPALEANHRQMENRSQRHADRLSIKGVGAARRKDESVGAEGGGVARHRPEIVHVGQVLQNDDGARVIGQPWGGRASPTARQPRWT